MPSYAAQAGLPWLDPLLFVVLDPSRPRVEPAAVAARGDHQILLWKACGCPYIHKLQGPRRDTLGNRFQARRRQFQLSVENLSVASGCQPWLNSPASGGVKTCRSKICVPAWVITPLNPVLIPALTQPGGIGGEQRNYRPTPGRADRRRFLQATADELVLGCAHEQIKRCHITTFSPKQTTCHNKQPVQIKHPVSHKNAIKI